MSTPQQPDLARSGRGATDPDSAKAHTDAPPAETGPEGPVPEDNLPGHHPAVEQDKPVGPPPRPKRAASKAAERKGAAVHGTEHQADDGPAADRPTPDQPTADRPTADRPSPDRPAPERSAPEGSPIRHTFAPATFAFAFEPRLAPFALAFGVSPRTTGVELTADRLRVRFGLWRLTTALDNIVGVDVTGPYRLAAVAGPPRLSFVDRGVTFATTTAGGVCIRFDRPVPAVLPLPLVRHTALTVTVTDPEALADAIRSRMP